ncbi:MAG: MBOAT family protein [Alphaproteobacteria bacterium]|nr:MBOAT family protein [Alphaproteobacteria bacterium]
MLFHTPSFAVFFAAYFLLHVALPPAHRLWLVVAGGSLFYGYWQPLHVWLPLGLTLIACLGAAVVAAQADPAARRRWLAVTVVLLLLPLAVFKYTGFLLSDVMGLASAGIEAPVIALPLGISFVTFTLIAYAVDVARRDFPPGGKPVLLGANVLFFPHLVAGPILRPGQVIPQLARPRAWRGAPWTLAGLIFTSGVIKKVWLADQLAPVVDRIIVQPQPSAAEAWLCLYAFAGQIYGDFSGYTDMAIGLALALGVRLPSNFRRPYAATSVALFWRRWHITLSEWLRDYLYIPLGGNRGGRLRRLRNVVLTMGLGGLWHGAAWTFVAWGLLHAGGILLAHFWGAARRHLGLPALPSPLAILLCFHFVAVCWIFFRAPDFASAARLLAALVGNGSDALDVAGANLLPLTVLAVFFATHRYDGHARLRLLARRLPAALLWPPMLAIVGFGMLAQLGGAQQFIYFEF